MDNRLQIQSDLKKAYGHLEYSFRKVIHLNLVAAGELDEETLETLESFASRFARFSDIAVMKYFRSLALEKDPAFRGSAIDLIQIAEKFGWIQSADKWRRIRELRNLAAHEYMAKDYKALYRELIALCPVLLAVKVP